MNNLDFISEPDARYGGAWCMWFIAINDLEHSEGIDIVATAYAYWTKRKKELGVS